MVGHSYICYGPLIAGATTVVYEGKPVGTPDAGAFWRVIADHRVRSFFTAPTAFRAIKREDPEGRLIGDYDISSLEFLFLAGERADPDTVDWAQRHLGVPVIDHWWQTETGWAIAANPAGIELLPVKPGSPTLPMPGWDVRILSETGTPLPPGELGAVAVKLPLPPGALLDALERRGAVREVLPDDLPRLLRDRRRGAARRGRLRPHHGAHRRRHQRRRAPAVDRGDGGGAGEPPGRRRVRGGRGGGRAEGPAAARASSASTRAATAIREAVVAECVRLVRDRIGPVAAFKTAVVVDRLPKTRSGKILRGVMGRIADGREWKAPATIDDPAILTEIGEELARVGFGRPLTDFRVLQPARDVFLVMRLHYCA